MSARDKTYTIVGISHIDLSWVHDSEHYRHCQEQMVVSLLDCLERDDEFTYLIEQIAQYRWLAERRADLVERLRPYVEAGRVEIGGAMASALDTNGPNGECYVRNHLLGRAWAREHLGGEVRVGELLDTFGISAQSPQIHRQLGMNYLLANRLGGAVEQSLFHCRGLDGSTILVAGPDASHSAAINHPYTHFLFLNGRTAAYDRLCDVAAAADAPGPHLVLAYDENENPPVNRGRRHIDAQNRAGNGRWRYGALLEFFCEVEATDLPLPTLGSDFNPAFTGCFGMFPQVRAANRRIETALMEAEKFAALSGAAVDREALAEAWWLLSYVQSHDIYSGSFPAHVMPEVAGWLEQAEALVEGQLKTLLGEPELDADGRCVLRAFNGLPWPRQDAAAVALPRGWTGVAAVRQDGRDIPFEVDSEAGEVRFRATLGPLGDGEITLTPATPATPASPVPPVAPAIERAVLENAFVRVECSAAAGVERIVHLPSGLTVAEDCGALLVVQRDRGSHQVDAAASSELRAGLAGCTLNAESTPLGQRVTLRGELASLPWGPQGSRLGWRVVLSLNDDAPGLDVSVHLDWQGEESRIRLLLPTTIDSCRGVYEIPFGAVERRAYGLRQSAGGEWPAHRFALLADPRGGVALVNRGAMGVETAGGAIRSTLLRSPTIGGAGGLRPDALSSQHGRSRFDFTIVPFSGPWAEGPVLRCAQQANTPVRIGGPAALPRGCSLTLAPAACVLSAIKPPEDGAADEFVLRFYETTGRACTAELAVGGVEAAWLSDLLETRGEALTLRGETMTVPVGPYEIKTLRLRRRGGNAQDG